MQKLRIFILICAHLIASSKIFNQDIGITNDSAEFYTAKKGPGRPKKQRKGSL